MIKVMQRVHVPTALVMVGVILTLFVAYHIVFGRKSYRR